MKYLALIVVLAFAVNAQAFTDGTPAATQMDLRVGTVEISAVNAFRTAGTPTLGGPGAGPGASNVAHDGYTAPSWATTNPSVFSIEQYSFPATASYIDHRTCVKNNAGPWPTAVALGYVWQECGNQVLHQPVPNGNTVGLALPWDNASLVLTLPYAGNWYITVGIGGMTTGIWDWAWLARYDGVTPIPVVPPGQANNDTGGGNYYTFALYSVDELRAGIGGLNSGVAADRPWCFEVY
jgi:hypothetical protein